MKSKKKKDKEPVDKIILRGTKKPKVSKIIPSKNSNVKTGVSSFQAFLPYWEWQAADYLFLKKENKLNN